VSRRTKALAASFDFAEAMIREKIDGEQKYVPDALYEMTGDNLKQYLAFAYREGMKYGSQVSPKGAGRGSSLADGPGRPGAKSSEGKAEQKRTPGDSRIGGGNATRILRKFDGGKPGPRPLDDRKEGGE